MSDRYVIHFAFTGMRRQVIHRYLGIDGDWVASVEDARKMSKQEAEAARARMGGSVEEAT